MIRRPDTRVFSGADSGSLLFELGSLAFQRSLGRSNPHNRRNSAQSRLISQSFDLLGERNRLRFRVRQDRNRLEQEIEIKLRNRQKETVQIRVVEHLNRWADWEVDGDTQKFRKLDAQTVDFRVSLKTMEEKSIRNTGSGNAGKSVRTDPGSTRDFTPLSQPQLQT